MHKHIFFTVGQNNFRNQILLKKNSKITNYYYHPYLCKNAKNLIKNLIHDIIGFTYVVTILQSKVSFWNDNFVDVSVDKDWVFFLTIEN